MRRYTGKAQAPSGLLDHYGYSKRQQGFTLLELMIAMAIFATLAVTGWQVFDGLTRAKERAQYHAKQLSELQYAYLQLQQDLAQIVAYQDTSDNTGIAASSAQPPPSDSADSGNQTSAAADTQSTGKPEIAQKPMFKLDATSLSFVRFADPDPRYQSSPTLIRVEYVVADQRLLRRQFAQIYDSSQAVSLDSVLLEDITDVQWQAYTPEASNRFPDDSSAGNTPALVAQVQPSDTTDIAALLPKGVGLSFSYHDQPLAWTFALSQPAPQEQRQVGMANANQVPPQQPKATPQQPEATPQSSETTSPPQ